jgi:magnesium-transporting ATPase (P-type)
MTIDSEIADSDNKRVRLIIPTQLIFFSVFETIAHILMLIIGSWPYEQNCDKQVIYSYLQIIGLSGTILFFLCIHATVRFYQFYESDENDWNVKQKNEMRLIFTFSCIFGLWFFSLMVLSDFFRMADGCSKYIFVGYALMSILPFFSVVLLLYSIILYLPKFIKYWW